MQKIQILFPDPVMKRLRDVARRQDRPVSELVRRAVDRFLEQVPAVQPQQPARFPTFHGGGVLVEAGRLTLAERAPSSCTGARARTQRSRARKDHLSFWL